MSFNSFELSPQASTRVIRMRAIPEAWSAPSGCAPDIGFLRSWFEIDSDFEGSSAPRRINWGAIAGLTLSVAVSAAFWTGAALVIERIWR
jgi:hypothetical protein